MIILYIINGIRQLTQIALTANNFHTSNCHINHLVYHFHFCFHIRTSSYDNENISSLFPYDPRKIFASNYKNREFAY